MELVAEYSAVQRVAKDTMNYIKKQISPGMRLTEIRKICENRMLQLGADSFWYYNVGAFVFSGTDTVLSLSGRKYKTADIVIKPDDIITIDLSPQCNKVWGDYARTLIMQNGNIADKIEHIKNEEWRKGLLMEKMLHKKIKEFASPLTTFEELFFFMNTFISENGYVNLDFSGNLGHSIEKNKNDRIYIEKGNKTRLGDAAFFTFEPHIKRENGMYGYKKENIYCFKGNYLCEI